MLVVDSTCFNDLVCCLGASRRGDAIDAWSLESSVEVTVSLLNEPNVGMPGAPNPTGLPSGEFGRLVAGMDGVVRFRDPDSDTRRLIRGQVLDWAAKRPTAIANSYNVLRGSVQFELWLRRFAVAVWDEHSQRMGGLLDPSFAPAVASVMGQPEEHLERLRRNSMDLDFLDAVRRDPDRPDAVLLRGAYVVSAIIRGRYYDQVAEDQGWQIAHHPFRMGGLRTSQPKVDFVVANSQQYFASILVGLAAASSDPIGHWTASVSEARTRLSSGDLSLPVRATREEAVGVAVRAVRSVLEGLELPRRRGVEAGLSLLASVGVGALTTFTLGGWESVAVTGAASLVGQHPKARSLTRAPSKRIDYSARRLRRLSDGPPGQVSRSWTMG